MECLRYLEHVHDKIADGKTAYEKNMECSDGHFIPFGANVSYKPISSKDESLLISHFLEDFVFLGKIPMVSLTFTMSVNPRPTS